VAVPLDSHIFNAPAEGLCVVPSDNGAEAAMTRRILILTLLAALLPASAAFADLTAFVGTTTTPAPRITKGFALGGGLLVVGFEFEFSSTSEDRLEGAPSLSTGMGNVLLQTPKAIKRLRPYFTTGGGAYRERLGTIQETQFGLNTGGGVKISLMGPVRARLDYRVFKLRGTPLHPIVNRLYAGLNVSF
jgi:opacity protein-like surface antigen